MDKSLFKEYEEWCSKNNKEPLNEENLKEFKTLKEKQEAEKIDNSKKEELLEKQKAIFASMCDYCGVKTKYDDSFMFDVLDDLFKAVVMATVKFNHDKEVKKTVEKLLG